MTLEELTNHESGIILYGGSTVGVFNWCNIDDNHLPIAGPIGMAVNWPEEDGVFDGATWERLADIRTAIPGTVWVTEDTDSHGNRICDTDLEIVSDNNNDLIRLFCDPSLTAEDYDGIVYTLRDGRKIIVLDTWN